MMYILTRSFKSSRILTILHHNHGRSPVLFSHTVTSELRDLTMYTNVIWRLAPCDPLRAYTCNDRYDKRLAMDFSNYVTLNISKWYILCVGVTSATKEERWKHPDIFHFQPLDRLQENSTNSHDMLISNASYISLRLVVGIIFPFSLWFLLLFYSLLSSLYKLCVISQFRVGGKV